MVEFMKQMEAKMYAKWRHAYVNYKMMKKQLKIIRAFVDSRGHAESLTPLKLLFQRTLDSEISKMLDFYKFRALGLRDTVDELEKKEKVMILSILNQKEIDSQVKMHMLTKYQAKWHAAATKLVRLLEYVSLNMQALRKVVKKQHKVVGALKPDADPALQATLIIQHPHENTQYEQGSFLSPHDVLALTNMESTAELKHAKFIIKQRLAEVGASVRQFEQTPTIAPRIRMMRENSVMSPSGGRPSTDRRVSSDAHSAVEASSSVVGGASQPDDNIDTAASVARARMLLAYPSLTEQRSSGHRRSSASAAPVLMSHGAVRRLSTAQDEVPHPLSGLDAEHEAEHDKLVEAIHRATNDLKRNAKLVSGAPNNLGFAAAIFEPAPLKSRGTTLGVTVQLLTTFLYMANYNLVIPTVDAFMEHLQVSSTTGGLMIGCADGSAIAIALLYSAWTNRSYRQPILAATLLCCVGNLLVTLAYDTGGLPLLLLGRLINGAGNARMISRRYMADFFAKEDRDRVSMLFVAASAFGMAFGPFITWPLSLVLPRAASSIEFLGLSINIITVGGWLMVLMWAAFYIFAYTFFDEPIDVDTPGLTGEGEQQRGEGCFADCTPAPNAQDVVGTDAAPMVATKTVGSTFADTIHGSSLGSSQLLHPPPAPGLTDSKVSIQEDQAREGSVTEPLLGGSWVADTVEASDAGRLSNEEAAVLPVLKPLDTHADGAVFAGTAAASSAVPVASADLSSGPVSAPDMPPPSETSVIEHTGVFSDHVGLSATQLPHDDVSVNTTDAQASGFAISQLRTPLSPTPGTSPAAAAWDAVAVAVTNVHFLPTVTCSMTLFLLKLLQQTTVSAVPVFTGDFYGWRESEVSLFMTAMSLAMFFVTIAATLGSGLVGRRVLIGSSLFFCGCGCLLMMDVGDEPISLVRYLASLSTILAFTNILEGVTMSVMGDVIHPVMAAGFLNAGLLSTQAGSIGRLIGNTSITVFGNWADNTIMLGNEMYLALAIAVGLCSLLFVASYSRMQKLD